MLTVGIDGIDVSPTSGTNDEQLVILTNKCFFFHFSKTARMVVEITTESKITSIGIRLCLY